MLRILHVHEWLLLYRAKVREFDDKSCNEVSTHCLSALGGRTWTRFPATPGIEAIGLREMAETLAEAA
jgi:hypothetical protein